MPYVLQIRGRTVVLDDADVRGLIDRLVRQTRTQVWPAAGGPNSYFQHYYHVWEQHNRCHSVNLFILAAEALGGADLPPASWANRLKREAGQLRQMIRPNNIGNFYQRFPGFNRSQARFVRAMRTYQSRMIDGATRSVRILEVTRDTSFLTLSVCASLLTAGAASGPAVAAASSGGSALLRAAATQFVISEMQNSATRLGRSLAGERVTAQETADDIMTSALTALTDTMLGDVVGRFMGPLTDQLTSYATREIARGSLLRGVGQQMTRNQIEGAVSAAVNRMLGRQPNDIRQLLESSRRERNNRGHANVMANGLQQNRRYRRMLEAELENQAR